MEGVRGGLIIGLANSSFVERKASAEMPKTLINERRGSGLLGVEEPHRARLTYLAERTKPLTAKRTGRSEPGSARRSP